MWRAGHTGFRAGLRTRSLSSGAFARPDDRLREAIHRLARKESVDCFVAALLAMTRRVRGGMKQPPVIASAAKQSIARVVIASAAKQSILPQQERMDCFAALAMTWRMLAMTWRRLAMTVSGRWHSTAR